VQIGYPDAPQALEDRLGDLVAVAFTGPNAVWVVFGEARPVAEVVVPPTAFGGFHFQPAALAVVPVGATAGVADMDDVFVFIVCQVALNHGIHEKTAY